MIQKPFALLRIVEISSAIGISVCCTQDIGAKVFGGRPKAKMQNRGEDFRRRLLRLLALGNAMADLTRDTDRVIIRLCALWNRRVVAFAKVS